MSRTCCYLSDIGYQWMTDERAMSHDETPQVTEDRAASSFVLFPDVKAVPIVDCGLVHRYNMRAEDVTFHSVSISVRRDLTRRRRRHDQRAGIYETCDGLLVLLAVMNTAFISLVAEARPFVAEWIERIAHCNGDRSLVEVSDVVTRS